MANVSKLRKARLAAGLTLQDFARQVGVAASTVSSWEIGSASPTAKRIPKVAKALNVTPEAVVDLFSA